MHSVSMQYLIVPGWQGSPERHWQSHWQRSLPNSARVEQKDWFVPQRRDWVAALSHCIEISQAPVILIAHSLGCATVAHWALQAEPELARRVAGALLIAPADVERPNCPEPLRNFAPLHRQALPFPALLVGSSNDPAATPERARQLAAAWGAISTILTNVGHINVKSGHERWEEGFTFLYQLQDQIERTSRYRA
ncbi:RBBP9/YdeN family alpha/beta hydrolase [Pseudomonas asuensis]|uniref:Alpha/beta hydrolase n=1 Tax=Pseudomonas asuensis TaxID=1825787 RepID=A0ABQ2GUN7_9PSED|nr:alpha/beta hydrolase [Pseudomonas asuensis]GGM14243.1 alpha/beta hydrolase [Pseudomonas asuensis]